MLKIKQNVLGANVYCGLIYDAMTMNSSTSDPQYWWDQLSLGSLSAKLHSGCWYDQR